MATRAIINDMRDFVKRVNSEGVSLKKAVLFGSYANNSQTKYSDIDIALVADEFSGLPSEDVKLFLKAMRHHYMVQPQTYNTKNFSPAKDPFVAEILKTGIVIEA